jgi:hypothetical protein
LVLNDGGPKEISRRFVAISLRATRDDRQNGTALGLATIGGH